jgi:hypothetical protein
VKGKGAMLGEGERSEGCPKVRLSQDRMTMSSP